MFQGNVILIVDVHRALNEVRILARSDPASHIFTVACPFVLGQEIDEGQMEFPQCERESQLVTLGIVQAQLPPLVALFNNHGVVVLTKNDISLIHAVVARKPFLLVVAQLLPYRPNVLVHSTYPHTKALLVKAVANLVLYASQFHSLCQQFLNAIEYIRCADIDIGVHIQTEVIFFNHLMWLKFGISRLQLLVVRWIINLSDSPYPHLLLIAKVVGEADVIIFRIHILMLFQCVIPSREGCINNFSHSDYSFQCLQSVLILTEIITYADKHEHIYMQEIVISETYYYRD